jgi:NAD(P)-dependent dehydrogenase (short-subunit alcohol dehydrogenase family)
VDLGLSQKNVVVTGGSKGIGLACARAFLREGARVAIISRQPENISAALAMLPGSAGFVADLRDPDAAKGAIEDIEDKSGPIDILVNSAGAAARTPAGELTPAAYRAAMDAKFFTYINPTDWLIKKMAARRTGVIVNVIGAGGKVAAPTHIAGGAANAALMLTTAGLANAYAGEGIRVLAVNPGMTRTDRVAEGLAAQAALHKITSQEAGRRAVAGIPLGRMAEPDEIANVVVFLASAPASYLTGVCITMDGAANPIVV